MNRTNFEKQRSTSKEIEEKGRRKKLDKWIKKQPANPCQQFQFDRPKWTKWKARWSRFIQGDDGDLKEKRAAMKEHEGGRKHGKVSVCQLRYA